MTQFFADLADQVPDYVPGSFQLAFGLPSPKSPTPMVEGDSAAPCTTAPICVRDLSCAEQWRADLKRLDEVEFKDACFFDSMGEIMATRMEDRT